MLTITPRAENYIQTTGIPIIRFGARPNKGCAGFEYIWEKGTFIPRQDYRINVNDKFMLVVSYTMKKYIDCCEIDLKSQDDGLLSKIEFRNEKTEVVCGCGESLNFADDIDDCPDQGWSLEFPFTMRTFGPGNDPWKNALPNENGEVKISPSGSRDDKIEHPMVKKYNNDTVREVSPNTLSNKYKRWTKE